MCGVCVINNLFQSVFIRKAMADTEEYFPRGGKKPVVQQFTKSSNFLGAPEREQKKKKKPKARPEPDDDGYLSDEARKTESGKNLAIGLGYVTAKPGTIILGRVRQVLETKMHISLPGAMVGTVMACHVSEPYNKLLEAYVNDLVDKVKELPDMFSPGQYVAVKVLEVKGRNLMLSMMPQHLYEGRRKDDFTSGFLLQAAVSSVEDHGYVMDVGVPNVRAFMSKKDANPEIELDTGMVTWCCVTSSSEASISLSGALEALRAGVQRKTAALLPGANVRFTVHKPLDNGIEGRVLGDQTAFVLQQHADRVDGKKPAIGQKFNARVLYVMPTRNTPFLTMRDIFATARPDLAEEQRLNEGDIVKEAQVIKIVGRSIRFKLGKGSIGVMSGKRVQVDEDLSDDQVLAKMYPIGSTHKVRILSYNLSDYTYSISDQPSVLNERYFTMSQLSVGEVVTATVKSVADGGATLNVGRFTGTVPHAHMTDAGIFIDPKKGNTSALIKKKFKVGQEVKARVLSVEASKQLLFLTLKPSLLAPDLEMLQSYAEAVVGRQYTGCIKHIKEDYILVSFFNHVVAFVPKKLISKEPIENLIDAFHIGQIVKCTITNVNAEARKMTGSFITEPFLEDPNKLQRKQRLHNDSTKRKRKADGEDDEIAPKKKKDKKDKAKELDSEETEGKKKKGKKHENDKEETNIKDRKRKKDKKSSVSEESDAIETDIHTEEEVLTPIDQGLVDLTDCVTEKQYKKRIVSLIKSIQTKALRTERINKKIESIEEKGLNAKNKKFHTAMHMEKLVIDERVKKLVEVLKIAQEKLKEISGPEEIDHEEENKDEIEEVNKPTTSKKDKGKKKDKNNKVDEAQKPTENKNDEQKKKTKSKEIKVVEDLEPVLEVPSAKDFWSASADSLSKNVQEEDSSSSDEEEKDQPKKKRKKLTVAEKVAKAREEEDRLRAMEARAIESEHQPRSSDQFERALLANPGCSQLWIAYMAFHLQSTEIDKARAVGRKALNTIPFRDEHERLNVWLALLNCEHRFGTKETQQKTLEDALQTNEPYNIHSALLDILVETGKTQELSSLVDLMMRKYRKQPEMYIKCGGACYKAGLVEKARQVMQKAVAALEKKEHVSVLVQFALMERSSGAPERAEALFEQVLAVYPARTDVCNVYVDMLVKSGDIAPVRQVMERMTSHKLTARKMKILFKKWIEVEEKIGDEEQVEVIRQRAAEYVDKAKF